MHSTSVKPNESPKTSHIEFADDKKTKQNKKLMLAFVRTLVELTV